MPDIESTVANIVGASTWDARVALIRRVPEDFGTAQHQAAYSAIAKAVYVRNLAPDFAYIHWREDYELAPIQSAYDQAHSLSDSFSEVGVERLTEIIQDHPATLRIFRLLLGLLTQEFAATTRLIADEPGLREASLSAVKKMETGHKPKPEQARCCAEVIHRMITGALFPSVTGAASRKLEKPDTVEGWKTVRLYAKQGVPLPMFLHQRHYGGSFGQLLNATSVLRGNLLEDAVEQIFNDHGVPHLRTGSHNQKEIEARFNVSVQPAPDFVVFNNAEVLQAMLECKAANDGGTARDKASRYDSLRREAMRLGGIPLYAVLSGLGWTRTSDALGPVVRDTDGRTFTLLNLEDMLSTQPLTSLVAG